MELHPIHERLLRGELILLDGALGSELERRGVATPLPLWSAQALLDAPETVRAIHEDYARAGADILATATFRTTPRVMKKAGRSESDADRLTAAAVSLAAEARASEAGGRAIWIGGSIGPLEDCYRPEDAPPDDVAAREHEDQARRLASAGVDLILLETFNTIREARAAAAAARTSGQPFTVSFVCRDRRELLSGEPLADAVRALDPLGPLAILVNCTPIDRIEGCLEVMSRATSLPIGCYPNAGSVGADGAWSFDPDLTPERLAHHAMGWVRLGAQVLGGCCGTGPEHIRALRSVLPPVLVE
jgi:S-methylmethionine-dependent homocysteine/selenocysteine methylase